MVNIFVINSIIMDYMDDGDLYQAITDHKKRNTFF